MSVILSLSFFLVAITVGRWEVRATFRETKDDRYWRLLLIDAEREMKESRRPPVLRRSRPPVCYPDIGCFSPSTGIVDFFENMYPYPPEDLQTRFYLFTKRNRADFTELITSSPSSLETKEFDPNVPVVLIVHGFNDNGLSPWAMALRFELLKNHDFNVITVDWRNGVKFPRYGQAIVNGELVSRQIAHLLVVLKKKRGYDIKKTHIIGYSLGAQVAGFTSKYLKQLGEGQVARISALDAAGPMFEDKDERVHVSQHDADFVDAIHTSAGDLNSLVPNEWKGSLGINKAIGHVDFYPNGGKAQPGCGILSFNIACSHGRAPLFYIESINSECEFRSFVCIGGYPEFEAGGCPRYGPARLGYHSNVGNARGVFYLQTNKSPPYCKE